MKTSNDKLIKGTKNFFKVIYVLLFVFIGITVLSQVSMLVGKTGFGSFPVIVGADNPEISFLANGETINPKSIFCIGAFTMNGAPTRLVLMNTVFMIVVFIVYIFIIRNIRAIIRSMEESKIFSLKNAHRLKNIGFLLLVHLILSHADVFIISSYFNSFNSTNIGGLVGFVIGESAGSIIAIVFTFFIAAVFKIGVSLQEENQSFV